MGNYTIFQMFENPRRGRQARNFTTNVPKIVDRKSSFEQIFSENCRWAPLKCLTIVVKRCHNNSVTHEAPVSRSRCFLNPRHLNPFSTVFLLSGSVTINAIKFSFLSSSRESIQYGPGVAVRSRGSSTVQGQQSWKVRVKVRRRGHQTLTPGGYCWEILVGVCHPVLKTPDPISDQKTVIFHIRFQTWSLRNYVIIT